MPEGVTFRHFLLQCDDGYILTKIAPQQEWDADATLQSIKDAILGMRRDGGWSKEEAREEWDSLEYHEGFYSEWNFWEWSRDTKLTEVHELSCYKYSEQARAFLERCWPRLKQEIKNDLGL
jgi:hypothetical protein